MATPKEHRAKITQRQVMAEKANESPMVYAQVGDGGGTVATGRANFYYVRLRGDENRVTQCYSLVPLANGDLIYVRQSQDRKLRYYEFVEFIQAAGGGTGPPVPYHNVLGPYHGDAATAAIVRGDVLIGDATPEINRLAVGAAHQIFKVNAGGTDPVWAAFDWDDVGAAAGADMVHDHSAAGEGGQLDWDSVWTDSVHDHSGAAEGGPNLNPETISTRTLIVGVGCTYTTLGAAVAAVPGTPCTIKIMGITTVEVGNVTVPAGVDVVGQGEGSIIGMGINTLSMSDGASLLDLVVNGTGGGANVIEANNADCVIRNVLVTGDGQAGIYVYGDSVVRLYDVHVIPTGAMTFGFCVSDTATVLMDHCHANDTTNFTYGLSLSALSTQTVTARYCVFRAKTAGDDVYTAAGSTFYHFDCDFRPVNSSLAAGTHVAQPTKRFNQWLIVAEQGGDFQELSEAVAWINAQGDNASDKWYGIFMAAGNYSEAGAVTIPNYVGVFGQGWATRLDLGTNVLSLRHWSSLESLCITSSGACTVSMIIYTINHLIRDCHIYNTGTGYGVYINPTGGTTYIYGSEIDGGSDGVYVTAVPPTTAATVYLNDCRISGDTDGLHINTDYCYVYSEFCTFVGGTNDVTQAGGTWYPHLDLVDWDNCTLAGTVSARLTSEIRQASLADILGGRIAERSTWYDFTLVDSTEGDHFRQNAAACPATWTEVNAATETNTTRRYSFWYIRGDNTVALWKYRIQTGVTLESLAANAWMSFQWGPFLWRDGGYTADLSYYMGIYRNNAGVIDETVYSRIQLYWNSAGAVWQIRGEESDGAVPHNGAWYTLTQPIHQPLFLRSLVQNTAAKKTRQYWGTTHFYLTHSLLQDQNPTTAPTWGQVWLQIHRTRGAGVEDYCYVGAVDYLLGAP